MTPFDKYALTYANCALKVGCAFRLYLVGLTINTNSTTTTTASTSPIQLTVSDDLKHQTVNNTPTAYFTVAYLRCTQTRQCAAFFALVIWFIFKCLKFWTGFILVYLFISTMSEKASTSPSLGVPNICEGCWKSVQQNCRNSILWGHFQHLSNSITSTSNSPAGVSTLCFVSLPRIPD